MAFNEPRVIVVPSKPKPEPEPLPLPKVKYDMWAMAACPPAWTRTREQVLENERLMAAEHKRQAEAAGDSENGFDLTPAGFDLWNQVENILLSNLVDGSTNSKIAAIRHVRDISVEQGLQYGDLLTAKKYVEGIEADLIERGHLKPYRW